jgi:hypothetical protein
MPNFTFKAHAARRLPDPVFPNCERHIFYSSVQDLSTGIPKGANPRTQDDVDRGIYRDVKRSLLNEEGTPNSFASSNLKCNT